MQSLRVFAFTLLTVAAGCAPSVEKNPSGADLSAVTDGGNAPCSGSSCVNGPKPFCDPKSRECVQCLDDGNCPSGTLCMGGACVPGCTVSHGCPDGGGTCDPDSKMCKRCGSDADCGGTPTPRCDPDSGLCVACLPTNDNCPQGKFCGQVNMMYTCQTGCGKDADCVSGSDGGAQKMACCNHVCVDTDVDGKNCGTCGTACGNKVCCTGQCADLTADTANCGMCGNACAGKNAMWSCTKNMCAVAGCAQGFTDCNMSPSDGCEANLAMDPNNCKQCGTKCVAANAVTGCGMNGCAILMCNAGFADCDKQYGDGCEVNTNGDPNNCGGCGTVCSYPNALAACVVGQCALAQCANGFSNCDFNDQNGCESNTSADLNNCGGCGMKCGALPNVATVGCANSMCSVSACVNGFGNCDNVAANGCEANFASDAKNCGGCNMPCNGNCVNGVCMVIQCPPGTMSFAATGATQSFTVPACVTKVTIDAYGAQGGATNGGKGARIKGDFTVAGNDQLLLAVGKQGVTNACGGAPATGGGGGGTFVWRANAPQMPLVAAGGGGGGNVNWNQPCSVGLDAVLTTNGTQGVGMLSAMGGANGNGGAGNGASGTGAGGAGWLTAGGNSTWPNGGIGGQPYATFTGGAGAAGFGPGGNGGFGGGGGGTCGAGGGGGYSGGGGGEGQSCRAGGGGGGSYNGGVNQTNTASVQLGDGKVIISW